MILFLPLILWIAQEDILDRTWRFLVAKTALRRCLAKMVSCSACLCLRADGYLQEAMRGAGRINEGAQNYMLYPSKIVEIDHATFQRKNSKRKMSSLSAEAPLPPRSPTNISEICMSSSLCTLDPASTVPTEEERLTFVHSEDEEIQEVLASRNSRLERLPMNIVHSGGLPAPGPAMAADADHTMAC
mmetsp:Transcript_3859/g.9540  ORF Transcript_3859/g.9540 Transcript_3859/m.9540 type:complete len:187 (-) Transcript_3859:128-688(-)|eukprot:280164-Hanusia_phi.AAC.5